MHLLGETFCSLTQIALNFNPKGPIDNFAIGSNHGFMPYKWQTITWTVNDQFLWCHKESMCSNQFINSLMPA